MRHLRAVSVLLGAAATVAVALVLRSRTTDVIGADDRLPLNPFVQTEKGDWAAFTATWREGEHRADVELFVARVVSVSGTEVVTRLDSRTRAGELAQGGTRVFSTVDPPTLARFFTPANARYEISSAKVEAARFETLGGNLACVRVAFDRRDLDAKDAPLVHVTTWLSTEIRGCGIVHALAEGRDSHGCPTSITFDLVGYGHEGRVERGKALDEIPFDLKPSLLPLR